MAEEQAPATTQQRVDEAFEKIKPEWCGILCWRVEEFKLVKWSDLGAFFTGDSYLIYHSYTKGTSQRIIKDIYFWLGSESTTDEIGTAAIKAVELDDFFGGLPTQYREVQYHESDRFRALWDTYGGIRYMAGGIDSGFRKVETDTSYILYQVKGFRNPILQQVPCTGKSLNHGDVFILQKKGQFIIWFGKKANRMEKNKGINALDNMRAHDPRAKVIRLENSETEPEFWEALGGETEIADASEGGDDKQYELSMVKVIYKLLPDGSFEKVNYARDQLKTDSIFYIQAGKSLVIYVGKKAPKEQVSKAFVIGINYLKSHNLPDWAPMSLVKEGVASEALEAAFA